MNRLFATFAGIAGALVAGSAQGSEKTIDKAAVPVPVLQAVTAKYPKATVNETVAETEDERTLYEVRLSTGTEQVDLKLDAAGKLLAEERPIALENVPQAVRAGLSGSRYANWQIKRFERIDNFEHPGQSGFEALVEKKGKEKEILFSIQGKILKEADEGDPK
jgi:Putative beta-lactamase-inhibitor-like, PepSY-like